MKLFGLSILQFFHLTAVLSFKLRFHIIIGGKDSIHVLFSLFLGIKEAHLSPIDFILEPCHFLLQIGVFTRQEVFVLVEKVNLAAKPIAMPLTISFALLAPAQLAIKLIFLAL